MLTTLGSFVLACGLWAQGGPVVRVDSDEAARLVQCLRWDEAEAVLRKQLAAAKRKRTTEVAVLEKRLDEVGRGQAEMRNTQRVVVVDSMVVDKKNLLEAYRLPGDMGRVWLEQDGLTSGYESERATWRLGARLVESEEGQRKWVLTMAGSGDEGTKRVEGLEVDGDENYPFLMGDGTTLYFAARDSRGHGNYDLYVTRWNGEDGRFYRAENLGFPFNSYANDYMLVVDEVNGVGWFASDRYQPEDKVCVYVFIPPTARRMVDFENTEAETMRQLASLRPIRSTWTEESEEERGRIGRLMAEARTQSGGQTADQTGKVCIVVDDQRTYTRLDQFLSDEARNLCRQWLQKRKNLTELKSQLSDLRERFSRGTEDERGMWRQQVMDMERRVEELGQEVRELEKNVRNCEINSL